MQIERRRHCDSWHIVIDIPDVDILPDAIKYVHK